MADNAVRNVESPFGIVFSPPAPVSVMSPACTVLSVQMRPTFSVEFSRPQSRHALAVLPSATAVASPAESVAGTSAPCTPAPDSPPCPEVVPLLVAFSPAPNASAPANGDSATTSSIANAALKRFVDFMSSPPSTASRPSISPCACICARSGFSGALTSSWARSFPHGPPMPSRPPMIDILCRSPNARTAQNRASRQRCKRYLAAAPPGHIIAKGGHMELRRICERTTPIFRFRRWVNGRQGVV